MIQLCIALKLQSSASFRAIREIIVLMNLYLETTFKAPTHSTVLLWVKKYGHYQLHRPKQSADDWVILLDESVQFGQNKLLVVYGIRQSQLDFSRPLNYQDLSTLALRSKSSWNGQAIRQVLGDVQQQIGSIRYAVADYGNPIKKALTLMGIPHVYDLTHCMSLCLGHIYRKDSEFSSYMRQLAHLRGGQALGKMAHVLPPAQRSKARFMNLSPLSEWGMRVINLLDDPGTRFQDEKDNLEWVNTHRELIMELHLLNEMAGPIHGILKTEGLSKQTVQRCLQIVEKGQTKRLQAFKKAMKDYFKQTLEALPDLDQILCSSDILESSFGKYKNYLQGNPMVGITNLSLSIAAFTGSMDEEEFKNVFESTSIHDIAKWTKSHIGKTTLAKRMEVLKRGENK